jgi:aminopeptidase N
MKIIVYFFFLFFISVLSAQHPLQNYTDVLHYRFKIDLNDKNDEISGETSIKIRFLQNDTIPAIKQIVLNLISKSGQKGMTVQEVLANDRKISFNHKNDKIFIDLPTSLNQAQPQTFTVKYTGIPADGLIISANKFGERTFFGDNWPNRASYWLPVEDHPSDKATCEFIVTAPDIYKVVSNGKLKEEKLLGNGLKLTHWQENTPIPTKVMVIGAARFSVQTVEKIDSIEVQSWVYQKDEKKGFYDYAIAPKVLKYFMSQIGPYSYEKLANVESKTIFGGMENAGCIFYTEDAISGEKSLEVESLVAHEIAHQWFGNSATEKDWRHIWLSEGFATYFSALFLEYAYGRKTLDETMFENKNTVFRYALQNPDATIVKPKVEEKALMSLLNPNSYQKGGWVLHMLRFELGDETFWKGIRKYYETYRNKNAETSDFQKMMESVSGKNLNTFFTQWLYKPGYPKIAGNWTFDTQHHTLTINLQQTQKEDAFSFPLEIGVFDAENKAIITEKAVFNQKQQTFTFKLKKAPTQVALDPNHWLLMKLDSFEKK